MKNYFDIIECSCDKCVAACKKKPGWFLPEEVKPAADSLGLTEKEFFDRYLAVDYFLGEEEKSVISPATKTMNPGDVFPFNPIGECIFLEDGKCKIHSEKPYECKIYDHRNLVPKDTHKKVAESWIPHKLKIAELLGREPTVF